MSISFHQRKVLVFLFLLVFVPSAMADLVYINTPDSFGPGTMAAQVRYRIDNSNFDQDMSPNGTNRISNNLGNRAALNNTVFNFTLQHVAGTVGTNKGFIFSMLNTSTNVNYRLAWGTFTPPLSNSAPNVLNQQTTINSIAPGADFNFIQMNLRAQDTGIGGSQMALSNLTFSGTGLTTTGSFLDQTATTPAGGPAAPILTQQLFSNSNLSAFDWTLSGTIVGFNNGSSELVRFSMDVRNVAVPEPGSLALGAFAALCGFGGWWLRRKRVIAPSLG